MMNLRPLAFVPLLIFSAAVLRAEGEPKETATAVVNRVQAALIDVMKNAEKLGINGRIEKLDPMVRSTHKLATVARVALGKNWAQLTEAQRNAFVDKFSTLVIVTYASNFNGFSGESFTVTSEQPRERGQVLVRTNLTKSDGGKVELDYVLERVADSWQIINIIADGVSDLALKRQEYESVISKEGFDGLMKKLSQKIEDIKVTPGH